MNFVHTLPHTAISIALYVNRTAEIGIVYNPVLEQLFTARRSQGAFYNGAPMSVSGEKSECSIVIFKYSQYSHKV